MGTQEQRKGLAYLDKFTSRKDKRLEPRLEQTPDSVSARVGRYLELAVVGGPLEDGREEGGAAPRAVCRVLREGLRPLLSKDARDVLAEYLETERPRDAGPGSEALFLSAHGAPARRADLRHSVRAVNLILERIGRWHDAEVNDQAREIAPLRPQDFRHTFAYRLAAEADKDAYELERRLGHGSQHYTQRYTNPPEDVAAGYVEAF